MKTKKKPKKCLLIDKNARKVYHCSYTHAATIIGVTPKAVGEWSKIGYKDKGLFECYFNIEDVKIERGFYLNSPRKG